MRTTGLALEIGATVLLGLMAGFFFAFAIGSACCISPRCSGSRAR